MDFSTIKSSSFQIQLEEEPPPPPPLPSNNTPPSQRGTMFDDIVCKEDLANVDVIMNTNIEVRSENCKLPFRHAAISSFMGISVFHPHFLLSLLSKISFNGDVLTFDRPFWLSRRQRYRRPSSVLTFLRFHVNFMAEKTKKR